MLLSRCYCITLLQRRALSTIAARATTSSHVVKSSTGRGNDLRPSEYELRIGFAIRVLQDELPQFFQHGLKEHSIYSQHIVLSDPHYTRLSVPGRTAYLGIAETLRWSLRLYFDDILFEITRLRVQPDQLEIRWRLEGHRHPSLFLGRMLGLHTTGPMRHYEGVFLYKFDSKGYINEHCIQHIVPPPSRRILFIHSLGGRLRAYWEEMKKRRVPELSPV
ncbi:predicted protein [Lichtheimia corymbifera JMRC:FSU:9682]|uniref:Uncharacterized protein n=1 Tax=Lichtheimia corymbifera JMRC:FSU:9682 TaxID=1263082 RepID=A0A068RJF5_9FUNG|nr:predicted protein [Lichtheimia corymbifera JMRC:FSU:9682]